MGQAAENLNAESWVYSFGGGLADGDASMKNLLGGKGANLAEMAKLGLPVPPGFTISTAVCTAYYELERDYPATLARHLATLKTRCLCLCVLARGPPCRA